MIGMELGKDSYDIIVRAGSLKDVGKYFNLKRKVMIVTDDGVPVKYACQVAQACVESRVTVIKSGEANKSPETARDVLCAMLDFHMGRGDCVVAVGGGVVGDLAGFAAAVYMRGIDYYNVPTTLLSQVDSSIGGKTAVNFNGIKNLIGAFHQPRAVLIDPDTLLTLPSRQISNGFVEAVKMGATSDETLFNGFLDGSYKKDITAVIERTLLVKKHVVECDEKEEGLRRILNFGHTIGHGFESAAKGRYLHGECVASGMLYMCSDTVKEKLTQVYASIGLTYPRLSEFDKNEVTKAISHDKKMEGQSCLVVFVCEIGHGRIEEWPIERVLGRLAEVDL